MYFEDTIPLPLPPFPARDEDDEALNDRLTLFAEYVDVAKLLPEED